MACFYQGRLNYCYKYIADCGSTSKWNRHAAWPKELDNEKLIAKFEKKLKDMKKILVEMVDTEKKNAFQAQLSDFNPNFGSTESNLQIEEVLPVASENLDSNSDSDSDGDDFDNSPIDEEKEDNAKESDEVLLGDALGIVDLQIN